MCGHRGFETLQESRAAAPLQAAAPQPSPAEEVEEARLQVGELVDVGSGKLGPPTPSVYVPWSPEESERG